MPLVLFAASGVFACSPHVGGTDANDAQTRQESVTAPAVYQVDSGGGAVSPFTADQFATGGFGFNVSNAVSTTGVANAAPAAVYQSERYGNFSYNFGSLTPNASYTVRLHFAEIYFTSAGARQFNVLVNGVQQLTKLDIFAQVGANRALVKDITATASSAGQISVEFVSVVDNAKSSGIEILSSGGAANQAPTVAAAATASPNPTTGTTSALSALGADDGGEANLTYTWATTGTPPGTVSFSVNGSNAAKKTTATFSQPGSYALVVTIRDASGLSVSSGLTVNKQSQGVADGCDGLKSAGTWENVTPPEVLAGFDGTTQTGVFAFAVDPVNAGTVYLGTMGQRIWKSQNCGSTWVPLDRGRNGSLMNGVNWTMVIDPTDPRVVYTNSGYQGNTNGAFKSTNGGVDWDQIWPPPNQPALGQVVQYNFANVFAMDPSNHLHLLLTFHAACNAPYNQTCIGETTDGGATWRILNGDASWVGTEGQVVYFLDNARTWLWGSSSNNYWRTEDAGVSWKQISPIIKVAHPQGSQLLRAKDGTFYLAASDGVFRSPDGKSWSQLAGTAPLAGGLVSDGTTMYLSNDYYFSYGTNLHPYLTAPEATGKSWAPMASPGMTSGGSLGYDAAHHVLYSSNFQAGFYRVVVR